ncbi:MAG: FG-GAP-like repeat-containing protein [Bacteroidota bacterium]
MPKIENRWSTAGTLIDINQDGLLDIYVVNYVEEVRLIKNDEGELLGYDHICQPNQLFINRGNFEFDEVADQFGADDEGCALATTTIDLNNDGVSDLYVANDFGEWIIPNAALINRFPEEKVENEADALGLDGAIYGMGIDATDYNGDGFPEIYVTNIGPNLYYEWDGSRYLNLANELKIQNDSSLNESLTTGWGALWLDHDNDGREDLVVSNGHITSGHLDPTSFEDPNKLYSRQPDGSFEDVTNELSLGNIDINRGVVSFDYDVDGDLDLLFSSVFLNVDADERNTLFHVNEPNNENHWVTFVLEGSTLSRDAIGAHISLFDKDSKRSKWVKSGVSHASKSSKKIHFGLGENEKVDSIMIRWPGGGSSVYKNFEADQTYYIKEGQTVPLIIGCMDPANSFYNPKANFSMGCKNESYEGCTDRKASNYNPEAIADNGNCIYDGQVFTNLKNKGLSQEKCTTLKQNLGISEVLVESCLNEAIMVKIFNLKGQMVSSKSFKERLTITGEGMPKGIYFILLQDKNGKLLEKAFKAIF